MKKRNITDNIRKRIKKQAGAFRMISLFNSGRSIKAEDLKEEYPELNDLKYGEELPVPGSKQDDAMYKLLFDTSFLYIRRN